MAVLRSVGQGVRIAPRTVQRTRERELKYMHGRIAEHKTRMFAPILSTEAKVIRFPVERRLAAIGGVVS